MLPHQLPDGCTLRHLAERDAEELERVVSANREHLARWLPWVDATADAGVEARREFLRAAQRQHAANDGFHAAIIDGGEIIGIVGFHRVDWSNRATSIGYWLVERRQGAAR